MENEKYLRIILNKRNNDLGRWASNTARLWYVDNNGVLIESLCDPQIIINNRSVQMVSTYED